jgi:hypothetical protein
MPQVFARPRHSARRIGSSNFNLKVRFGRVWYRVVLFENKVARSCEGCQKLSVPRSAWSAWIFLYDTFDVKRTKTKISGVETVYTHDRPMLTWPSILTKVMRSGLENFFLLRDLVILYKFRHFIV